MIDKFVNMCELISVDSKVGTFLTLLMQNFTEVYNDTDYPVLKEKMDKLIGLINEYNSLIEKDVQDELWLIKSYHLIAFIFSIYSSFLYV